MKIFLIVLLIIFCFFGILLISSVNFKVYLSKDGYFIVKYLFFSFKYDVYGENKLKSVKKTSSLKNNKSTKKNQGYFKKNFSQKGIVEGVVHFLNIVKLIVLKIYELAVKCEIKDFVLNIKTVGKEPAETAIYYGALCSVIYPAIGILNGIFPIKKQNININADYDAKNPEVEFSATFKVRVLKSIKVLCSFIKEYIQGGF